MSNTPRTDAFETVLTRDQRTWVPIHEARKLERELAETHLTLTASREACRALANTLAEMQQAMNLMVKLIEPGVLPEPQTKKGV